MKYLYFGRNCRTLGLKENPACRPREDNEVKTDMVSLINLMLVGLCKGLMMEGRGNGWVRVEVYELEKGRCIEGNGGKLKTIK